MVSSATTAVASASPYPLPSQLAQLQASQQGTPFILPQQSTTVAASSQIPYGSLINPGKPRFLGNGLVDSYHYSFALYQYMIIH